MVVVSKYGNLYDVKKNNLLRSCYFFSFRKTAE